MRARDKRNIHAGCSDSVPSDNGTDDFFPLFCCRLSLHRNSRIKPLLEVHLEALKHLFFNVFDVGELASIRVISQSLRGALKLHNEFLHQPQLVPVFSRRCCLQISAVCFCRFLVTNPILGVV